MKIQLIDNWQQAWKFYSIQAMAVLMCLPTLYDLAVQYGLIDSKDPPAAFSNLIRIVAFIGAALRLIKQQTTVEPQSPTV